MWPTMREANAMIEAYSRRVEHLFYADTAAPMLGNDGKPRIELFSDDGLHLNEEGYKLWSGVLRPYIEEAYGK